MITTGQAKAVVLALLLGAAGPAAAQQPRQKGSSGPRADKGSPRPDSKPGEPSCDGFYWSWPTRERAFLGVELLRLTGELRAHFGGPSGAGLLVARVEPKSPAAAAGVKVGDLLVALDGKPADSRERVVWMIRRRAKGDRVTLRVMRNGKSRVLQATLDVRETPQVEVGTVFRSFGLPGGVGFGAGTQDGGAGGRFGQFDPRCLQRTMQRLQRQMRTAPPGRRIFRFLEREEELERRLQQMEQKLHKLERRLRTGESGA